MRCGSRPDLAQCDRLLWDRWSTEYRGCGAYADSVKVLGGIVWWGRKASRLPAVVAIASIKRGAYGKGCKHPLQQAVHQDYDTSLEKHV